jgi:hypothetical protein
MTLKNRTKKRNYKRGGDKTIVKETETVIPKGNTERLISTFSKNPETRSTIPSGSDKLIKKDDILPVDKRTEALSITDEKVTPKQLSKKVEFTSDKKIFFDSDATNLEPTGERESNTKHCDSQMQCKVPFKCVNKRCVLVDQPASHPEIPEVTPPEASLPALNGSDDQPKKQGWRPGYFINQYYDYLTAEKADIDTGGVEGGRKKTLRNKLKKAKSKKH